MTMFRFALPLLLAATPAAANAVERPVRIGETARVGGPTVRPIAVIEDSRCPVCVVCVWAGRLVVRAEIGIGRGKKRIDLTLGMPVRVADGTLTLRQVTPGNPHGRALRPSQYRFTFEFAGGV